MVRSWVMVSLHFQGCSDYAEVTIKHLLGKHVEVYWVGSCVSKRWKSSTVAAHERHGDFWLEYDNHFDDKGNQFFLEKLLTEKSPQWRFEGDE